MKKRLLYILLPLLLLCRTTTAQNNPYVDDRLVHLGFSVGMNFMSFGVTPELNTDNVVYNARVSSLMPGFCVNFITDLRLSRHLSLRFTPGLEFASVTVRYKDQNGNELGTYSEANKTYNPKTNMLLIPINFPIYLKWAAEREVNYRPYLIGGGGISCNIFHPKNEATYLIPFKTLDYFVEFGFGCDFYFKWFKCCPELTYRVGFANQFDESSISKPNPFTRATDKLLTRTLILTFNFE